MTAATELYDISTNVVPKRIIGIPGDDDPLNVGVVLLDGLENTEGTVDGRDEELIGIIGVHVEWRGGMCDSIDSFYSFIECSFLREVLVNILIHIHIHIQAWDTVSIACVRQTPLN